MMKTMNWIDTLNKYGIIEVDKIEAFMIVKYPGGWFKRPFYNIEAFMGHTSLSIKQFSTEAEARVYLEKMKKDLNRRRK